MADDERRRATDGIRRPPPAFRAVDVFEVRSVTPFLTRVTFHGEELAGLRIDEPAASVRLLLPSRGTAELVIPDWNGNEFLLPDGARPIIRTFTPLDLDLDSRRISLDVVMHDGGATSAWVAKAQRGDPVAISGPSRGHRIDRGAAAYVLAGDETARPAIGQLIDAMPSEMPVEAIIELRHPGARLELPRQSDVAARWLVADADVPPSSALVDAMRGTEVPADAHVWAAGEAAAMQRIRRHLYEERRIERTRVTVRGYWKHGR